MSQSAFWLSVQNPVFWLFSKFSAYATVSLRTAPI